MIDKISFNFCGLAKNYCFYNSSKIVIQPVPFDKTSTWQKGSDRGPDAIIEASMHMELYDIETNKEIYLRGIHTAPGINADSSELMIENVRNSVNKFIKDDKFIVLIGGEHSVSIGSIKAYSENINDLTVIHLDAHTDRRDSYEGSKYSHASVVSRVSEYVNNIISIGIRSMDISEYDPKKKGNIYFAQDIEHSESWLDEAIDKMTERVYITIDLDVFDPSIMPSTGTPEPGGIYWYQMLNILKRISSKRSIAAFDVVELCPIENLRSPDFLAAKLIYKLLNYIF